MHLPSVGISPATNPKTPVSGMKHKSKWTDIEFIISLYGGDCLCVHIYDICVLWVHSSLFFWDPSLQSSWTFVTCSHEMIDKSCHAVPRFSLKTVVGVNLGEIEIFALCRSSFIFTPYTCSFLLYSPHKCFKFCKWSTYWSIRHWEMTPKWPIFTEGLLSVTCAEPHVSHTKTKDMISRCELLTWLFEIIQQKGAFEQSLV